MTRTLLEKCEIPISSELISLKYANGLRNVSFPKNG